MILTKDFAPSRIGLALGIIFLLLSVFGKGEVSISGVMLILSAGSYISLKKRKMGLVSDTKYRRMLEIAAMLIATVLLFYKIYFLFSGDIIVPKPALYFVVAEFSYILIPYLVVYFYGQKKDISIENNREDKKVHTSV